MRFAIARGYIVTAQDDGSVGLNARIAAQVDPLAGKQYAELIIHQANAAPDLLEALEGLMDQLKAIGIPDWHGAEGLDLDQAHAAITKAKGE